MKQLLLINFSNSPPTIILSGNLSHITNCTLKKKTLIIIITMMIIIVIIIIIIITTWTHSIMVTMGMYEGGNG